MAGARQFISAQQGGALLLVTLLLSSLGLLVSYLLSEQAAMLNWQSQLLYKREQWRLEVNSALRCYGFYFPDDTYCQVPDEVKLEHTWLDSSSGVVIKSSKEKIQSAAELVFGGELANSKWVSSLELPGADFSTSPISSFFGRVYVDSLTEVSMLSLPASECGNRVFDHIQQGQFYLHIIGDCDLSDMTTIAEHSLFNPLILYFSGGRVVMAGDHDLHAVIVVDNQNLLSSWHPFTPVDHPANVQSTIFTGTPFILNGALVLNSDSVYIENSIQVVTEKEATRSALMQIGKRYWRKGSWRDH